MPLTPEQKAALKTSLAAQEKKQAEELSAQIAFEEKRDALAYEQLEKTPHRERKSWSHYQAEATKEIQAGSKNEAEKKIEAESRPKTPPLAVDSKQPEPKK